MKFRHLHSQLVLASTVSIRPRRSRTKAASAARRGIKLARKPKLTEHQQREGDPPARPIDSLAPLAGRVGVRGKPPSRKDRSVAGQERKARGAGTTVAARSDASGIRVMVTHPKPATWRLQVRPPRADWPVLRRLRLSRPALDRRTRWRPARGPPRRRASATASSAPLVIA